MSARFKRPTHGYGTRQSNNLQQKHYNTVGHGRKCFTNLGIHIWNNLPNNMRATTTKYLSSSFKIGVE